MLGGPLQVLLQALLAPDLVTSSGTQSFSPTFQSITAFISNSFPPSGAEDGCQAPLQNTLRINVLQSERSGWGMGRSRKWGWGEVREVLLASGTLHEPTAYIPGK